METMTTGHFMAGLGRNSLQSGVLAVLLVQWLSGKRRAPRWRCTLWLLAVVRLLVPFSFGSAASIFNLLPHWTKIPQVSSPLAESSLPMTEIKPRQLRRFKKCNRK